MYSDLNKLLDVLHRTEFGLPVGGGDKRADSMAGERQIVSVLQNENIQGMRITALNTGNTNRAWADLRVKASGREYFLDIKITQLSRQQNDNTNSKGAIFYLLTGIPCEPKDSGGNTLYSNVMSVYAKSMSENENLDDPERDFFYLIVDKDPGPGGRYRAGFVRLRDLVGAPAGNNPPFQASWRKNNPRRLEAPKRTLQAAKDYLLGLWSQSEQSRQSSFYDGMPKYYPAYFKRGAGGGPA